MELKHWLSILCVIINVNAIVQHAIQIRNGIMKHVNVNVKIIVRVKKIIVGRNPFVRIVSIKKSIVDGSVILCNEIINLADSVSTNVTNIVPVNVMNTLLVNSGDKMDCYVLYTFL